MKEKHFTSLIVSIIMLVISMLLINISTKESQAATKSKLDASELEIGIGTYGNRYNEFNRKNDKYQISIDNPVKNAKYTFKSSNKKILTVKASGSKVYLTGIKAGKAIITCNQTIKNKTTIVGKCKVTVYSASINDVSASLPMGTGDLVSLFDEPIICINNRIPDAKYTFDSGDSNLIIKESESTQYYASLKDENSLWETGSYFVIHQTYTAKKPGTYAVAVYETYKGKTKKVGVTEVIINDFEMHDNFVIPAGGTLSTYDIFANRKLGMNYYLEGDGFDANKINSESIIYITDYERDDDPGLFTIDDLFDNQTIHCVNGGTVKLKVLEGKNKKTAKYIGSITIQVDENYISFGDNYYITYIGEKNFADRWLDCLDLDTASNVKSDTISFTISDESILRIGESEDAYDKYGYNWEIIPLKAGTTTIEAKCGDTISTCIVTVYPSLWDYKTESDNTLMDNTSYIDSSQSVENSIKTMDANELTTFMLTSDGDVWMWGTDYEKLLGINSNTSYYPINLHNSEKIIDLANYYFVKMDGTVWKYCDSSTCLIKDDINPEKYYHTDDYYQVEGLTDIVSIDSEYFHALALSKKGEVWSWGNNELGQLGNNTNDIYKNIPQKVNELNNIVSISASKTSSYALDLNGTVWSWGDNRNGQLGIGTYENSSVPVKIKGLSNIKEISAQFVHAIALDGDGNVWQWGDNFVNNKSNVPVKVEDLENIVAISEGSGFSLALKSDGTVWAWGTNAYGQFGDGTYTNSKTPVQVKNLTDVKQIFAGTFTSFAVKMDGTVWGWGANSFGALGDGTKIDKIEPVKVFESEGKK